MLPRGLSRVPPQPAKHLEPSSSNATCRLLRVLSIHSCSHFRQGVGLHVRVIGSEADPVSTASATVSPSGSDRYRIVREIADPASNDEKDEWGIGAPNSHSGVQAGVWWSVVFFAELSAGDGGGALSCS